MNLNSDLFKDSDNGPVIENLNEKKNKVGFKYWSYSDTAKQKVVDLIRLYNNNGYNSHL